MQRLLCVWGNPPCVNTIWNALRIALGIFSGKNFYNFGVQKRLRAFLNPIFTGGVWIRTLGEGGIAAGDDGRVFPAAQMFP